MKYLSILMVGVALLDGGYGEREVADEKPAKEEAPTKVPMREVDEGELERRDAVKYVKDETEPFTGWEFLYRKDGSKAGKRPHLNGIKHGTMIWYSRDGWKLSESAFVNGKEHGTQIWYRADGSKRLEVVWENDKKISEKKF